MNSTLVLWLSADLGYSDTRAGSLIAAWSSMLSLCTVLVGSFTDAVGLRRALLLGFGIYVVARAVMSFAPTGSIALPFGLLPLAFGEALRLMALRPTASHDEIPPSGRLTVLSGAAPALWLVFGLKLVVILAYGIMNSTLVLWLSADLGYSDTRAGSLIAAWSSMLSLCTVLVGSFFDAVGLRRALLLGFGICRPTRQ